MLSPTPPSREANAQCACQVIAVRRVLCSTPVEVAVPAVRDSPAVVSTGQIEPRRRRDRAHGSTCVAPASAYTTLPSRVQKESYTLHSKAPRRLVERGIEPALGRSHRNLHGSLPFPAASIRRGSGGQPRRESGRTGRRWRDATARNPPCVPRSRAANWRDHLPTRSVHRIGPDPCVPEGRGMCGNRS